MHSLPQPTIVTEGEGRELVTKGDNELLLLSKYPQTIGVVQYWYRFHTL